MNTGLAGKRALVLGASKGLGFGIAEALAGEGARVAVASRTAEAASRAAERIGSGAVGFAWDTGKVDEAGRLFEDVKQAFGGVDVLVLNSGGPPPGSAHGVASVQWRSSFESMFVGLVHLADLVLPGMVERRWGRLIGVISSGVIEPIPNLAISNAIRPALVGWGKTLANEVAKHGVTMNFIAPGRIATDRLAELDAANAKRQATSVDAVATAAKTRIPAGRYGSATEFGAAAAFLASEAASFTTGSILRVDGGQIGTIG